MIKLVVNRIEGQFAVVEPLNKKTNLFRNCSLPIEFLPENIKENDILLIVINEVKK